MSNTLSVRRVKVQTLNEQGEPDGEPSYGVMAADSYYQAYSDIWESFDELNAAIKEAGCILTLVDVDGAGFAGADLQKIGTNNFCGNGWEKE
jgi:hypothetical protein